MQRLVNPQSLVLDLLPRRDDLPGDGWRMVGGPVAGAGDEGTELFDCVGPEFPRDEEVIATGESARFVHPPRKLLYAVSVEFDSPATTARAANILEGEPFARCLGRSVAADLAATPTDAELLEVHVTPVAATRGTVGNRLSFTAAGEHGVLAVHLDVVVLAVELGVSVLWLGDTDHTFPADERDHVIGKVLDRTA